MSSMTDIFGPVIHSYSRAQGIEDGALIDVTGTAAEAGFKYPVALTASAWADAVAWTQATEDNKPVFTGQDEAGRLWDVLYMAMVAIKRSSGGRRLNYSLARVPATGKGYLPKPLTLSLVCGPGDNAEPVITIMSVWED